MTNPVLSLGRRCFAEAIGTFFLVLIGPGAAVVDAAGGEITHVGVALSFAFVVMAMVYALGHISGAHINPAVTIAFAAQRLFPVREVGSYVIAQLLGAAAAAFALRVAFRESIEAAATVPHFGTATGFGTELLLSFGLMLVIMAVATDPRVDRSVAGIAIGFTVGFEALAGGPVTGASMNPARSFGPALASGVWTDHWLYWVATIGGALLAAFAYQQLRAVPEELKSTRVGTEGAV